MPGHGTSAQAYSEEDNIRPFWNLFNRMQSGPAIELFAVQPACNERFPLVPQWELLATHKSGSGGSIHLLQDPRFNSAAAMSLSGAPELPYPIYAAAIGRFLPSEDSALLASLAHEDTSEDSSEVGQTLRISRLGRGLPPQPILIDRAHLGGRAAPGGLAAVDIDGDGQDELAVFVRENTADYKVAEHVEVYSLGTSLRRVARWPIPGFRNERTLGILTSPTDLETPTSSLALATTTGFDIHLRLFVWSASARSFHPLEGRSEYFQLRNRDASSASALALSDADGDGRNELAFLNEPLSRLEQYKISRGEPGAPGELIRWIDGDVNQGASLITAKSATDWSDAPRTEPDLIAVETLVNRATITNYQQRDSGDVRIVLTQAQAIELPPRNELDAVTEGHFFGDSSERLLLLLRREGRQQYLDAWRVDDYGRILGDRQPIEKWRVENRSQVLDNGIAAADLDGDRRDELIIARQQGSDQELTAFALDPGREITLRAIADEPRRLPRDERFMSMAATSQHDGSRDRVAILTARDSDRQVPIFDLLPSTWSTGTVLGRTSIDARITAISGIRGANDGAPLLALGRESSLAKFLTPLGLTEDGVHAQASSPWYVLDERAVLLTGWR
jgi:hypothetical protein